VTPADEIRTFLRSARARVRPEDPGLQRLGVSGGVRRVPGLRRQEVAQLAGVSVDYYTRLEQGRAGQVSDSVLEAVSGALRLNSTEREYLWALVDARTRSALRGTSRVTPVQRVRSGVHSLLESMATTPAFVVGRGMSLLAMNHLARVVLFDMDAIPAKERNLARWTFLDPEARRRYVDWETVAADAAAILRMEAGTRPADRALHELVGELTVRSADFRRMWSDHHVYACTFGSKRLMHPSVGRIDIDYEAFDVPGDPDQKVFVYTATSGSASADALSLLASWGLPAQGGADAAREHAPSAT
jgi:transcriptional regulator with XRE-family HTH domain